MIEHPKAMHKDGQVQNALSPEQEKQMRKEGWIDGNEHFSPKPEAAAEPEAEELNLQSMTKAELVEHAAEVHDLELHDSLTKAEMIGSIEAAQGSQQKTA